ncbi:MAG: DNA polymerase III subunit delta [Kiritimatiellae bacterium]|nr:DNA polymerase III subunit delta [Kiritimatiellia bacterium]
MTQQKKSIYLIFGTDEYEVSVKSRAQVNQLCPPEQHALSLDIIEARVDMVAAACEAIDRCLQALQIEGLFSDRNVVWLKDANFFSETPAGKSKETKRSIEKLVHEIKEGLSETHLLVISSSKIDKRSAFYKACKAIAEVSEHNVPDKSYQLEEEVRGRVQQYFREASLKIDHSALELFIERVGTDIRQIMSEAEKLVTYMGSNTQIQSEDVNSIVSAMREALSWDLADAVGRRDLKSTLHILRQLVSQQESDVGLIIGLENSIRLMLQLRECLDRGWVQVRQEGRWKKTVHWVQDQGAEELLSSLEKDPRSLHPFRASKLIDQAQHFSLDELREWLNKIVITHEKMISTQIPSHLLLEFLLIDMLGKHRKQNALSRCH